MKRKTLGIILPLAITFVGCLFLAKCSMVNSNSQKIIGIFVVSLAITVGLILWKVTPFNTPNKS